LREFGANTLYGVCAQDQPQWWMFDLPDRDAYLGCQDRITRLLPIAVVGDLSRFSAGGRVCFDHPFGSLKGSA